MIVMIGQMDDMLMGFGWCASVARGAQVLRVVGAGGAAGGGVMGVSVAARVLRCVLADGSAEGAER